MMHPGQTTVPDTRGHIKLWIQLKHTFRPNWIRYAAALCWTDRAVGRGQSSQGSGPDAEAKPEERPETEHTLTLSALESPNTSAHGYARVDAARCVSAHSAPFRSWAYVRVPSIICCCVRDGARSL